MPSNNEPCLYYTKNLEQYSLGLSDLLNNRF
ncbi:hypothetical protein MNBD_GAMMA04-813, partial [hydrothermal vent metagenome]